MWTKWWAPASVSEWRLGFNSTFLGLMVLVSGDFNVNYLVNSKHNLWLDATLSCYKLSKIADFPTRIQTLSGTAIVSIFTDTLTINSYSISSLIDDLSDNDAL
jgi:hypothetical protein